MTNALSREVFLFASASAERMKSCDSKASLSVDALAELSANLWNEIGNTGKRVIDAAKAAAPVGRETISGVLDQIARIAQSEHSKNKEAKWTVVLDLTTDFDHNKDGSFNRIKDLEQFAERTKGTGLVVVAQAAYRVPPEKPIPYGVGYKPEYRIERYVVRDGKIATVFKGKSNGYGQDLEDLVRYASHSNKAPKMALIMDTHGLGNEGLSGDTGDIELKAFISRVQAGLKGSEREKFDLLHFDSCLMSQNGVMERIGPICKQVVASAELEPAKGISLIPPLEILATKPETDEKVLGKILVGEGRTRAPEFEAKGFRAPLRTVASIDISKYAEFRKTLDEFGDQLTACAKDPKNKEVITGIVDNTFRYQQGRDDDDVPQADLKDFANRIGSAIADGKLDDKDGALRRASAKVQVGLSAMIDDFYGHKQYAQTGGLSIFLPTWYHRAAEYLAESKSISGQLIHLSATDKFKQVNKDDKSREQFQKDVDAQILKTLPMFLSGGLPAQIGGTMNRELTQVSASRKKFAEAKDDASRELAFEEINKAAKKLHSTLFFQSVYAQNLDGIAQDIDESFRLQLVDDGKSGWSRFQNAMRYKK